MHAVGIYPYLEPLFFCAPERRFAGGGKNVIMNPHCEEMNDTSSVIARSPAAGRRSNPGFPRYGLPRAPSMNSGSLAMTTGEILENKKARRSDRPFCVDRGGQNQLLGFDGHFSEPSVASVKKCPGIFRRKIRTPKDEVAIPSTRPLVLGPRIHDYKYGKRWIKKQELP